MANHSEKKNLYFVTGSKFKFQEAKDIFQSDIYELVQYDLDLPEYQGESLEVAIKKCLEAEAVLPENIYPFFIEDTGLHYNCLGGMPGPYIKWFLKSCGLNGLGLLTSGHLDKTAYAQCIITLKMDNKTKPIPCIGKIEGRIVNQRGPTDFGWDPIFEVDGYTFAEMEKNHKNKLSHRFLALKNMGEYLSNTK